MVQSLIPGAAVLVTGASGFLGAALCRLLVSRGAEVHGVSRTPRADSGNGIAKWWHGSLAQVDFIRHVIRDVRPDYIFHLAGAVTGVRDLAMVPATFEANATSAMNVLTAAAEQKVGRVVIPGSLEEPDAPDEPPSSPYAASKAVAHAYARMFQSLYGLSVVVPRVFIVYGPGQDDPKKLIPYVVSSLLRGESPTLSSGKRPIDWIYVDDVAEGLIVAALARDVTERFDLGSGQLVTTRDLVERLASLVPSTGGAKPLFGALLDRPMEQVRVADVARTSRLIGWSPRTTLDEGLRRTVEWLRGRFERV